MPGESKGLLFKGLAVGLGILVLLWALADISGAGRNYLADQINQDDRGLSLFVFKEGQLDQPETWRRLAGTSLAFPLGPLPGAVNYQAFLVGWLDLAESQAVTVSAGSDDGVRVYINGVRVIDDWSEHPLRKQRNTLELDSGPHLVVVHYYQKLGESFLDLALDGPGGAALPVYPLKPAFDPVKWRDLQAMSHGFLPVYLGLAALAMALAAAWMLAPWLGRLFQSRFGPKAPPAKA